MTFEEIKKLQDKLELAILSDTIFFSYKTFLKSLRDLNSLKTIEKIAESKYYSSDLSETYDSFIFKEAKKSIKKAFELDSKKLEILLKIFSSHRYKIVFLGLVCLFQRKIDLFKRVKEEPAFSFEVFLTYLKKLDSKTKKQIFQELKKDQELSKKIRIRTELFLANKKEAIKLLKEPEYAISFLKDLSEDRPLFKDKKLLETAINSLSSIELLFILESRKSKFQFASHSRTDLDIKQTDLSILQNLKDEDLLDLFSEKETTDTLNLDSVLSLIKQEASEKLLKSYREKLHTHLDLIIETAINNQKTEILIDLKKRGLLSKKREDSILRELLDGTEKLVFASFQAYKPKTICSLLLNLEAEALEFFCKNHRNQILVLDENSFKEALESYDIKDLKTLINILPSSLIHLMNSEIILHKDHSLFIQAIEKIEVDIADFFSTAQYASMSSDENLLAKLKLLPKKKLKFLAKSSLGQNSLQSFNNEQFIKSLTYLVSNGRSLDSINKQASIQVGKKFLSKKKRGI